MELHVRRFAELSAAELHELYRLRVSVFVVEQHCPYQEIDDADPQALHVWLQDEQGVAAYLRVLPRGVHFADVSLGRVIAARRHAGLGSRILAEGITIARRECGAERIVLAAQCVARPFYEKSGFAVCSEEFVEDGIPHVMMELRA